MYPKTISFNIAGKFPNGKINQLKFYNEAYIYLLN